MKQAQLTVVPVCPQGAAHRTASMTSLNSQESSNDIGRLTDKQQAEYRNAYQEYIAQMSQLELGGVGGERPVQPQPAQFMTSSTEDKSGDSGEVDGRRALKKTNSKTENQDFAASDGLDPITEEDERGDHGSSKSLLTRKTSGSDKTSGGLFQGAAELKLKASAGGGGPRYQKLTSDDDESEESDNGPLKGAAVAEGRGPPGGALLALKGKDYLSDALLDKKDSSDSGVRSNESSPNHSLQDEEADLSQLDRSSLIELDAKQRGGSGSGGGLPSSLSGLQDPAVARMSICSEDQCSLLASSPEESSWPSSRSFNLNRTPSNVTLNNNANRLRQPAEGSTSTSSPNNTTSSSSSTADIIISPTSSTSTTSTTTRLGPNNENVRVVHLKRGLKPGDPPEICTVSSDTVTFGEERESIL